MSGEVHDLPYWAEYAKTGRSSCHGCNTAIAKDVLRLAVMKQSTFFDGKRPHWYHFGCFFRKHRPQNIGDIQHYGDLRWQDRDKIKEKIVAETAGPGGSTAPAPKGKGKDAKKRGSENGADLPDGPPVEKKVKVEKIDDEDVEAMKKENELMYEYRDALKTLKTKELTEILQHNGQDDATGLERKLDRLSDIMTFGALERCTVCADGQLVFSDGIGYRCTGDLSVWSKCTHVEKKPKRKPCEIPEMLQETHPFLKEYKCKVQDRILPKALPTAVLKAKSSANGVAAEPKVDGFAPFCGMAFYIIGRLETPMDELKSKIVKWGGKLTDKLTPDVVAVISTQAMVDDMADKMCEVQRLDIHVVPESFIDACKDGNAIDKIKEMSISSWGSDPKARVDANVKTSVSSESKSIYQWSPSKVTLKVKDGSAVDPESNLEDIAHVYKDKEGLWNAILNKTIVHINKNAFYKLQLLEADDSSSSFYWVFRAWGRIGTNNGGRTTERFSSLSEAKKLFAKCYFDKTGNEWANREKFEKKTNKYYPIDVDYGDLSLHAESDIPSKLSKPVQDLVMMLFDVDLMKKVMMEFELDLEKMPLGKLSKSQIEKAYSVLAELQQNDGDVEPAKVSDLTHKFYALIPHDFGIDTPPLLNNKEIIQDKFEMLESLMEMEGAYSVLKETKGEGDGQLHPVDYHYYKLNTDIAVLEKDSEEVQDILKYVKNTQAPTHSDYSLEVMDVFRVKRNGEDRRFQPFEKLYNKRLLWHGSRVTNFAGILSQGLRIAPPEAPVTGYMFGKGIYFADMVSKSANYCVASSDNPQGLLLLGQVALGEMYVRTKYDYIDKLPPGKHSCKGLGSMCPDPAASKITIDGVEIPYGEPVTVLDDSETSLLYNEYIVYDVAQVKLQYLVKLKFDYKQAAHQNPVRAPWYR